MGHDELDYVTRVWGGEMFNEVVISGSKCGNGERETDLGCASNCNK